MKQILLGTLVSLTLNPMLCFSLTCYPPPRGGQLPITAHCEYLVDAILYASHLPHHNDVQTWGRGLPSDAHTESLPKTYWLAGRGPQTCAIDLDAESSHLDARENFRLRAVGIAGARIKDSCLKGNNRELGEERLGPTGHVIAKLVRSDSPHSLRMTRGAKVLAIPGFGELMVANGTYIGINGAR